MIFKIFMQTANIVSCYESFLKHLRKQTKNGAAQLIITLYSL